MRKAAKRACPECGEKVAAEPIDRRDFLRAVGGGAAVLAAANAGPAWGQEAASNKTAEEMIKELHAGLNEDQKKSVVSKYEDPARLAFYNKAMNRTIGDAYTKPQQELVARILRSISSDEDGWRKISRGGTWDGSKSFEACGANIFGDPSSGKYTWVFSGHHLTIRCDGNTDAGAAFGGPLYYGHTPNGYSDKNLFFYQTKSALNVFDSFNEAQRKQAVVIDTPGEGMNSVKFRAPDAKKPGINLAELTKEQQELVQKVMRDLLSPYRKADADEVMEIVKTRGGLEKIHLAFFHQEGHKDVKQPWEFWRLEGPGFVWNYRVLPHVHTFVNISGTA